MLVSMTGFGQGDATRDGSTVSVEIRTVNHRFLDYSVKLPKQFQHLEREVKDTVRRRMIRGRVYVTATVESEAPARTVAINEPLMARYLELLRGFAATHDIDADVDLNTLAALPDAFVYTEDTRDDAALQALLEESLEAAVAACAAMREEEGRALEKDTRDRIKSIETIVGRIEKMAPGVAEKQAETYRKRIAGLLDGAQVDQDRLMTEVSILAEKVDFTEEITRLKSHLGQFNATVDEGGEVSKRLTYLLQEIHREASTIGAKASDSGVIQEVVLLKEETEKIREQIQNIE